MVDASSKCNSLRQCLRSLTPLSLTDKAYTRVNGCVTASSFGAPKAPNQDRKATARRLLCLPLAPALGTQTTLIDAAAAECDDTKYFK